MSQTTRLCARLEDTQEDVSELRPYVVDLDGALKDAVDAMAKVKEVSDNLSKLDDTLGTISLVLTALSPLPVVGQPASVTKKPVDVLKKGVHPVRTKANQFEKKVKPVREKTEKVQEQTAKAIEKLDQLKKAAGQFEHTLETTYSCLRKKNFTALIDKSDKFSSGVRPEVVALNKALTSTTNLAKSIEKKLSDVKKTCDDLVAIGKPIDDVMDKLSGLTKALKPIEDALKQKISVPYSVRIKGKWWQPWKWKLKTQNFSFSVKQVLDGINTGIGAVNDALETAAKAVLKKLKINLPKIPSIPGLDKLDDKIDNVLGFIGQLSSDLSDLGDDIKSLGDKLDALNVAVGKFDIKC